jgi:hypothetical protein
MLLFPRSSPPGSSALDAGATMLATAGACTVALGHTYDGVLSIAVQVAISAGALNPRRFGVYVLRRRVQQLLEATQALSHQDPLTGLANRALLVEQAPRVWRQARREGSRWPRWSWTSTTSNSSTTPTGTPPGRRAARGGASLAATVRPSDVLARTGGEELIVLGWSATRPRRTGWPSGCGRRCAPAAPTTGHAVTASIGHRAGAPGRRGGRRESDVAAGRPRRRGDVRGQAGRAGPGGRRPAPAAHRQFHDSIPPASRATG